MMHYVVKPISILLQPPKSLKVNLEELQQLNFEFTNFTGNGGIIYHGDYEVTPTRADQILDTNHKAMTYDVIVYAIPYRLALNESGGYTSYIAEGSPATPHSEVTNKVVFGQEVIMDLTSDTIEAEYLARGITAHGADGQEIVGTAQGTYIPEEKELILPTWLLDEVE